MIMAFERKCYRKIMGTGRSQEVTNEKIYTKVKLKRNLLQKVIWWIL